VFRTEKRRNPQPTSAGRPTNQPRLLDRRRCLRPNAKACHRQRPARCLACAR
jgi:hypothetical protein